MSLFAGSLKFRKVFPYHDPAVKAIFDLLSAFFAHSGFFGIRKREELPDGAGKILRVSGLEQEAVDAVIHYVRASGYAGGDESP